jgi:hypothetical protein
MSVVTKKIHLPSKDLTFSLLQIEQSNAKKNRSFNLQPLVFKIVDQSLITHRTIEKMKSKLNYPCTRIKEEIKA